MVLPACYCAWTRTAGLSLARLLCPSVGSDAQALQQHVEHLLAEDGYLARMLAATGDHPDVFVVDQFEEVFTLCDDDAARQTFVANLLHLLEAPGARHTLLLTMRADFESHVVRIPGWQRYWERHHVRVTPLNATEIREAIELPAERVGLKFEPRIVDELMREILGGPGRPAVVAVHAAEAVGAA